MKLRTLVMWGALAFGAYSAFREMRSRTASERATMPRTGPMGGV